jgi:hypothetical protein
MRLARIIIVATDEIWAQDLAARLRIPGTAVEIRTSLDAVSGEPPALCVLYMAPGFEHLPAQTIVVVPRSNLASSVDLLQRYERVVAVALPEPDALAELAKRFLGGEPFGLSRVLPAKTQIFVQVVGDAADKARCQAQISELVERVNLPVARRAPIEQCVDEMLMNALYDAPVDTRGSHIFAGVPARARITMRTEQTVVVQYGFEGSRFAVGVRDAFGSIDRATIVRFLHKSLHAAQAVDSRAGGAGLGLYLMATAATAVLFHIIPGVATEVVCVFDTNAPELDQLAIVVHDPSGRPAAKPARRIVLVRPRLRRAVKIAAPALVALALGAVAWPKLFPSPEARLTITTTAGAHISLEGKPAGVATDGTLAFDHLASGRPYRVGVELAGYEPARAVIRPERGANAVALVLQPVAVLDVTSQPSAADVEVDGKVMGTTPLHLTTLAPGTDVTVAFARSGYRSMTMHVQVPARGESRAVAESLARADDVVEVHVTSTPPGAVLLRDGQHATADRLYTPADVFVEAGHVQHWTLAMPKHTPFVLEPFTPEQGSPPLEKTGVLVPTEP